VFQPGNRPFSFQTMPWMPWAKVESDSRCLASNLRNGLLAVNAWWTHKDDVAFLLLEYVIPFATGLALLSSGWLALRQFERSVRRAFKGEKRQLFSRKGLVVSLASLLFAASCFYRSIFVADEGAGLCRGSPSMFNAPVSGRFVATIGEIALVVQISSYIMGSARRLGVTLTMWTTADRHKYLPVVIAECLSWSGVLTGIAKFFCLEYVVWMFMALTWTWDGAILLMGSRSWWDCMGHCGLFLSGIALFFFNACVEIPHFFQADGGADGALESAFECHQDIDSPIWAKRLPFFFAYFLICSWGSVAISYGVFRSYGWGRGRYSGIGRKVK